MDLAAHAQTDYLQRLAARLDAAPKGGREALLDEAAGFLCVSVNTVYNRLRALGRSTGRKVRSDKGSSSLPVDGVNKIAALVRESTRKTDVRLPVSTMTSIAQANGWLQPGISSSTVHRTLRARGLHPDQLAIPKAHVTMRSLHPNHVWQLDPSICVLYYLRGADGLRVMDKDKFYKNKPANLEKIVNERVLRYVVTDHTSSTQFVRYYVGAGETQILLFEFLMEAMTKRERFVMHGVPFILIWDAGSANESHAIKALLRGLGVRVLVHMPGNPRAKGQVEGAQYIIERQFEQRLFAMRIHSLEELNAAVDTWQIAWNSTQEVRRHGSTRWAMWQLIRPEQLRIVPERQVCQQLLTSEPQTRKVSGNYTIRFTVPRCEPAIYDVSALPNIRPGDTVSVCMNPYALPHLYAIHQEADGSERYIEVRAIAHDRFGLPVDAPVFGESYQAPADSELDTNRKALSKLAYGVETDLEVDKARAARALPFEGQVDMLADAKQAPRVEFIERRGTQLHVPDKFAVEVAPLDHIDALLNLRSQLGRPVTADESALVCELYPQGVPEEALPELVQRFARPRLRIVSSQAS